MSQRFTLVSYFTASRSPSLILTAAASDSAGGLSNIGGLQVAWANAAWERHVGRMEVEDDDPVDAHRDDLLEFFTAADWDVIEREVHAHLAAPESVGEDAFELDLAGTVVSVTLLRGKAAVVLTLPPPPRLAVPSPPPSTKLPGFIVALSGTEMGRRIAEFPWETTSLGPLSTWSKALQVTTTSCLTNPFRTYLCWGHEKIFIYNDAYKPTALAKHPRVLGLPVAVAWPEVYPTLQASIENAFLGEVMYNKDHDLPLDRNGFLEETFHSYSFAPVRDEEGIVQGIQCISFETTLEVVTERRMQVVKALVEKTSPTRTVVDFCDKAVECLASDPLDLPFVLLYTTQLVEVKAKPSNEGRPTWSIPELKLGRPQIKITCRGAVGVPSDHPFYVRETFINAPRQTPRSSGTDSDSTCQRGPGFHWPFEQACQQTGSIVLDDLTALASTLPGRAWGQNPRQVVVKAVWTDSKTEDASSIPAAILIFGVNPRSQYTPSYQSFARIVARHVCIGLLAVTNAEADNRRATDLLALDRAKTSFFSSTSHELRTPLTLILGPLEDILEQKEVVLSKDVRDRLEMATRNANRLLSLVNKGGRTKMTFRPLRLGRFTADLASLFRDATERRGLQFNVECADDPPNALPTYISREHYRNILFNVLGNALKYTPSGRINVSVRASMAEVCLEVSDTGVGIPEEELENIFERFHRVNGAYSSVPGTGIGLALTQEIVKSLGGQLEVESKVGEGSVFRVRFRRGYIHLPSEQVSHDEEELTKADPQSAVTEIKEATSYHDEFAEERAPLPSSDSFATDSAEGSSASGGDYFGPLDLLNVKDSTILLAEDSPDLRNYITSILEKHYNVVAMPDGQSALEYALLHPPSLVLSDVNMPRLGGDGLLSALRANSTTALIPVIFLSAEAGTDARALALERGCDDYIVKPFLGRELLARVRVHLTLGRIRIELEAQVKDRTAQLAESDARYRALAQRHATMTEVSPVGIFQMDATPTIVYANPRWYDITGHPVERSLFYWQEDVHPDDLPMVASLNAEIRSGRDSGSIQFRYRQGNWVQLFRRVVEFGPTIAFIGTVTDIQAQKEIEFLHLEAMEQRAADAESTRVHIENFIDITSHELRNPLSGVWQNAEMVGRSLEEVAAVIGRMREGTMPTAAGLDDLANELKENLEGIQSILICAAHQGRIADDILNVSKLSMGLLSISPTPFDLVVKMTEVARMFETECSGKEIHLGLVIDDSIHLHRSAIVVADPSRLAQICVNFLLNGAKYTPSGGRITINVSASPTPPPSRDMAHRVGNTHEVEASMDVSPIWVTVAVVDTGRGLTSAEIEKLFERFRQTRVSDQTGGAGLGLYLSKLLVELMRGWIEVESVPGEGSCFSFTIPVERASASDATNHLNRRSSVPIRRTLSTADDAQRKRSSTISSGIAQPARRPDASRPVHVLIVEDNAINQKVLKRQLASYSFDVSVASNGQEALDFLQSQEDSSEGRRPDVVLMDIEMPILGGVETIRRLRARELLAESKTPYGVIAVTGNGRQEQIDSYLVEGFTDVTIKPYNFSQLLVQIETITGRTSSTPPTGPLAGLKRVRA